MAIPDFQSFMRPLLESIADGKEYSVKEVKEKLAVLFNTTEEERRLKIPSQRAFLFDNRLGWANTYLKKAGLVFSNKRGSLGITESGKNYLLAHSGQIKLADLKKNDGFNSSVEVKNNGNEPEIQEDSRTPEEIIDSEYEAIKANLVSDLIALIKTCSPLFFENLVVDLLIAMGYGGSRKEAGKAIGRSGDGGIDGIINEDKLGLDSIYIQAKRWENTVPVKKIRDFAGSLLGRKAKKGVFITTSDFPESAYDFAASIDPKMVLIDGKKLAELMIENKVGVTTKITYEIKDIDHDYFEE